MVTPQLLQTSIQLSNEVFTPRILILKIVNQLVQQQTEQIQKPSQSEPLNQ